ncbi:hypothetical protein [Paenibacillus thermotolerans]|uniref:hypothetical protein n=1 Tax=Paenibacillus thermotolerans TaxID=3027807 RepID=UPI0023687E34|nr:MULTISPECIES: hypothetical protein [unclassified Paenibacillus]
MDNKNGKQDVRPSITNYDWVWGSDQDQYVKDEASATIVPAQETTSGAEGNEGAEDAAE